MDVVSFVCFFVVRLLLFICSLFRWVPIVLSFVVVPVSFCCHLFCVVGFDLFFRKSISDGLFMFVELFEFVTHTHTHTSISM